MLASTTTHKKRGGERGSEVVEFGLVCVPFFAFMLLILDIRGRYSTRLCCSMLCERESVTRSPIRH